MNAPNEPSATSGPAGASDGDDFLTPGGALQGALFMGLLRRLDTGGAARPGARIGAYRCVRELGRGGMGVVYLAERVEGGFEQTVAVKFVRGATAAAVGQELFRRERNLLAALDHPHIARLIDGGQTDDGWLWFAMEHVDGLRIDRHIHEHRLDLPARLRLFRQVCEAVAFAHQRLVVHRDIKPANILVTPEGWVKLLDFGGAALADAASAAPHALTPNWASPEQRRGEPVTTASDVFQLGLLLRHLVLLGEWQRTDSTELDATRAGAPTVAAPRAQSTMPDRDLAAIVEKCTGAELGSRYASVGELDADVMARIESRPVAARGGGALYRATRLVARRPLVAIASTIALLAIVALAWWLALERNSARQQAARAIAAAHDAERESRRAQATLEFLSSLLGEAQPAQHKGKVPSVEDLLQRGGERLLADSAQPPPLRAELLATLGSIHIERGEFAQAERLLEAALPLMQPATTPPLRIAEARGNLAYTFDYSRAAESLAMLDRSLADLAGDPASAELRIRFARYRASILHGSGQREAAAAALKTLLEQATRELGESHAETAAVEVRLAHALGEIDRIDEALPHARHAYDTLMRLRGGDDPQTLQAGSRLAVAYYDLGRYDENEALQRELLPHIASVFGDTSPRYARALTWYGSALLSLKRRPEAIETLQRALRIYDSNDPKDDLGSPNTIGTLGDAYRQLGDHERALALYRQALQRAEERPGAVPADSGISAMNVVRELVALRRFGEAGPMIDEARARATRTGTDKGAWIFGSIDNAAAHVHAATGHAAAARVCAEQAVAILRTVKDADNELADAEALLAGLPDAGRAGEDCAGSRW